MDRWCRVDQVTSPLKPCLWSVGGSWRTQTRTTTTRQVHTEARVRIQDLGAGVGYIYSLLRQLLVFFLFVFFYIRQHLKATEGVK